MFVLALRVMQLSRFLGFTTIPSNSIDPAKANLRGWVFPGVAVNRAICSYVGIKNQPILRQKPIYRHMTCRNFHHFPLYYVDFNGLMLCWKLWAEWRLSCMIQGARERGHAENYHTEKARENGLKY
jgi:hypothetical protein